ncbi:B3GA2 glucuronosyltransferase, partial [Amia calva]|nr:B3GA2 glucuronosyltransferase [Amia calva]
MKSLFYSRFFILLPWVLIVIIMIDIDTKRTSGRSPAHLYVSRLGHTQRMDRTPRVSSNRSAAPVIYAITPTYSRAVQKAELTRLANTFRQVPHFHWLLVEDSHSRTELVSRFLARSGRNCEQLHLFIKQKRNHAPVLIMEGFYILSPLLIRYQNCKEMNIKQTETTCLCRWRYLVVATPNLCLWWQMRSTRTVSVWPVGLVGGRRYERPVVDKGRVVGWYTGWRADRPFAIDMAGFAVSLQVILANPKAVFKRRGSQPGMQESDFLKQITKVEDLEPKAQNCTRVLVWHTRTEKVNLGNEPKHRQDTVQIEV